MAWGPWQGVVGRGLRARAPMLRKEVDGTWCGEAGPVSG